MDEANEPRIGEQSSATATEAAAAAVSLISSTIPIVISIHDIILYDDTTTCFSVVSAKQQWPQHLRQISSPQCGPSGSFVVEANPVCSLNLTHFNYCNVFAAVCALQMDNGHERGAAGGGWGLDTGQVRSQR